MPTVNIDVKGNLISIVGAEKVDGEIFLSRHDDGRIQSVNYNNWQVVYIGYRDGRINKVSPGPARDKVTVNIG